MGEAAAIRDALDLMHVPSRVRQARAERLPPNLDIILRIAAGDAEALQKAAGLTGRDGCEIERAAGFYIEQILFAPEADSYRILGASKDASPADLRRNMALLMQWLHPDKNATGDRTIFSTRITRAWEDLKTQERRAAYDSRPAQQRDLNNGHSNGNFVAPDRHASNGRRFEHMHAVPRSRIVPQRGGFIRHILRALLGAIRY